MSVSLNEDQKTHLVIINTAEENGFTQKPVNLNDVIVALSHFSSQAMGVDGIPHSVIMKSIPIIEVYLVSLFNSSLSNSIYPSLWKEALECLQKSEQYHLQRTSVP